MTRPVLKKETTCGLRRLWLRFHRHWNVSAQPMGFGDDRFVAAQLDVPLAFAGTPDGDVRLAVAVVVGGYGCVAGDAPGLRYHTAVLAAFDQPLAHRFVVTAPSLLP